MEATLIKTKGDIFISPFSYLIFTRFNRNALDNTESELIAMAAPPKQDLSSPMRQVEYLTHYKSKQRINFV